MLKIYENTNKIYLTKGDNANIEINLTDDDGNIVPIEEDDVLTLTIRSEIGSATTILSKTASDGIFTFSNADTSALTAGLYFYDIQYQNAEGWKETIIPPSLFELGGEVTV